MFKSVKISLKLPLVIVSLCVLVGVSISSVAYQQSRQAMLDQVVLRIDVMMKERAAQLERWAQTVMDDVGGYSTDPTVRDAITGLSAVFSLMSENPKEDFQQVYIHDNPHPVGEKDKLIKPDVPHPYHVRHGDVHPFFVKMKETDNYYDVYLFDLEGNLVYSVYKENDFATNFMTGEFSDSGLGQAYRAALEMSPGEIFITEFAPYAPSNGAPAAFVATPVVDQFDALIGVYAIQLPLSVLTDIVNNPDGLAETGEVFVADLNGVIYSQSRHDGGPGELEQVFNSDFMRSFGPGYDQTLTNVPGYDGGSVLAIAEPTSALSQNWTLVAEMDMSEALGATYDLRNMMIVFGLVGICVAGIAGVVFSTTVTRPLSRLRQEMNDVAARTPGAQVSDAERGDEIGEIAQTLLSFKDKLDASDEQTSKRQAEHEEQARVVSRLNAALLALASGDLTALIKTPFAAEFEELRSNFNSSLQQLSRTVRMLVETSGTIQHGATNLSHGSLELSQRTESQAATLEETAAALDELTQNVESVAAGAREAEDAVKLAKDEALKSNPVVADAVDVMNEIEASSKAIADIVNVINDIAFQTNLLALNAGVEAARAGEAGRGFAVVASEVQALSQRTTEASRQIGDLITGSTDNVTRGVGLVGAAGDSLGRIAERVTEVTDLMANIATNVADQANAMREINMGVSTLDQVTQQNAAMVEATNQNSQSLNDGAQKLAEAANQFRVTDNSFDVTHAA